MHLLVAKMSRVKSHTSVGALYVSTSRIKLSARLPRNLLLEEKKKTEDNTNVLMEKSKCFDASLSLHQCVSTDRTISTKLN
jgi:hypothetical protein